MTPTETSLLVHHILDHHHALLKRELPRLGAALKDATPRLRAPFAHLQRTMEEHMAKEENILFPAILELCAGGGLSHCGVAGPVTQMQKEHEEIATLEDALRQAARDAGELEKDLLAMLDDLCEHARTEDEDLFPSALALEEAALRQPAAPTPPPAPRAPRAVDATPEPTRGREVRATRGVCPECHGMVPAAVTLRDGAAWLEKRCPEHGTASQLLSNRPDYWAELDRFYFSVNSQEYPQRDYIVRMTERCNLACPICLAKANTEDTADLDLTGLAKLLSERRGIKIDLMAAEPTLRPDLLDWIRRVKASGNIAALHTNGLKLADREYATAVKEAGVDEVFLQFDGMDDEANKALRGRPLLKARMAALANLRELGIATSLIVVIAKGLNEEQVVETYRFALRPENAHIREVFFLGLRALGSARHSGTFADQMLMPDQLIDLLTAQEPTLKRKDIHDFNLIYFAMLSAFKVRKCLYIQHYLVARDGHGAATPIADVLDLGALSRAAVHYSTTFREHPQLAKARLTAALIRQGLRPAALRMATDLVRLEQLFATGMNLTSVPRRFLLLGFITACDPDNFDADVAVNCGKGELSVDGGFTASSAVANIQREVRFADSNRDPGKPRLSEVPRQAR
jgi:sulfatase maturation enzyme AslB (radical SAM superfamily)/hemerythrin-like domain-containing protein